MIQRATVWASSLGVVGLVLPETTVRVRPITHKVTLPLHVYSSG